MPRPVCALALFLAAIGLAGCSPAAQQDATRDETTGAITENEDIGVFRLRQGDCLLLPSGGIADQEVEAMEAIPCDEPHEAEVLALVAVAGDDDASFPGQDALTDQAVTDCVAEFELNTGRDFMTDPDWDLTYLSPTANSWAHGNDREIVCLVIPLDGEPTTELAAG